VVGLSRGLSGGFAVRFSLLLSIPAVFGSFIIELYVAIRDGIEFALLPTYLAGFVIAVVVGFFAIQIIRRLISKGGFGKFAYYCWGVGILTLIMSLFR
jgi:undecaprenyl-diphosphatase